MVVSDKNAKNGDTNEAAYLSLPSPWATAINIEHGYMGDVYLLVHNLDSWSTVMIRYLRWINGKGLLEARYPVSTSYLEVQLKSLHIAAFITDNQMPPTPALLFPVSRR